MARKPSKSNLRRGPRKKTLPKGGARASATKYPSAGSTRGQMSHMGSC